MPKSLTPARLRASDAARWRQQSKVKMRFKQKMKNSEAVMVTSCTASNQSILFIETKQDQLDLFTPDDKMRNWKSRLKSMT